MRSQETPLPGGQAYSTEINGRIYEAYLLSATRGNEVFVILIKLFGSAIASAVNVSDLGKFIKTQDIGDLNIDFTSIVKKISENLNTDEYINMVKTLTGTCTCDGSRIEFDGHFRGRYGEMFKVLGWTIKINFEEVIKDFFLTTGNTSVQEDRVKSKSQNT